MHDLATIQHLNREAIRKEFPDTPIYWSLLNGEILPPSGSTPTTAHDAIIASQVARKRERWSTPPIFADTLLNDPTEAVLSLSNRLLMRDAHKRHALHRRETFSEFTNVRWYELDRHSDEL